MSRSLELIEIAHGLLRDLPDCRLWGVDDGALVLGEDATQYVFCWHGALTVRQSGMWPHVLTAGCGTSTAARTACWCRRCGWGIPVSMGCGSRWARCRRCTAIRA